MDNKVFIQQLEDIITDFKQLDQISQYNDFSEYEVFDQVSSLTTRIKSAIVRISGENSEYYKSILKAYDDKHVLYNEGLRLRHFIGIVNGLKGDLENDYLKTYKELIHSDIFNDYLEMSEYLLTEGYKDSAAVIGGSTLESHLRTLCVKNGIPTEGTNSKGKISHKKADLMNSELNKLDVYTKTYQKQITAWLDLRNNAAHGKYPEYTADEVKLMLSGIRNFMINYIA